MGAILGWLNVILLTALVSRIILIKFVKKPNQMTKILNKAHPWTAYLLFVSAIIHSSIMWGSFVPHSGQLVFAGILLTGSAAFSRRIKPIKGWIKFHIAFAFIALLLMLLHIFFPDILS